MICKGCGAELSSNQVFCPHCGTKNEPAGNTNNTKKCVNCGKEFTEDKIFCNICGGNLVPIQPANKPNMAAPNQEGPRQMPPYPMPNQAPMNQAPMGQTPMNQAPIGQTPMNQAPMGQTPMNQAPMGQAPSNQNYMNSQAPNQEPARQMPPYQMPGQVPPGQVPPRQVPPGQVPPGQVPSGQVPPRQMPPMAPGMMPPVAPAASSAPKKKNPLLPIFIIVGAVIFILVGTIGILKFIDYMDSQDQGPSIDNSSYTDNNTDDTYTTPDTSGNDTSGNTDSSTPDDNGNTDGTSNVSFNFLYNYSELPDVPSLDSYSCFTLYDSSYSDGVGSYTYVYNDPAADQSVYATMLSGYADMLEQSYGYFYEEDFSSSLYYDTGDLTDYYSKGDYCIGVTAGIEDTGLYAYVNIYDLTVVDSSTDTNTDTSTDTSTDSSTDTSTDESTDTSTDTNTDTSTDSGTDLSATYPNYYNYIDGRDENAFDQYAEVYMENGIAFYLNDITWTDQGDGTAVIDCSMDLAASIENCSLYTDDFMVMPMDADGNLVSDAVMIDSVVDSNGSELSTPMILDTDYYYTYKVSFVVPSTTDSMTFYGLNIELDPDTNEAVSSGSVYYIDIQFE